MQKIQASDPSASNVSLSSVEDCQSQRANYDDTDTSISSDLLNAGGRVVKGKLRKVDPRKVRRSRMANRSIDDEPSSKLLRLTELMRQAGTNTVPALVQELASPDGDSEYLYELVYGHRRHHVCLSESLPFTTIVVPQLEDVERTFLMAHENEGRVPPCPMDMAIWLLQLATEGQFKNQAALAQATGIKPASVTNLLKLARLPAEVVAAFPKRSDIGHRHALPLEQAAKEDLNGLIKRAQKIATLKADNDIKLNKLLVMSMLTGALPINAAAVKSGTDNSTKNDEGVLAETAVKRKDDEHTSVSNRDSLEATQNVATHHPPMPLIDLLVQRFNRELPLVTSDGEDAGQVFAAPAEDTVIRLPFSLNDAELDVLAVNVGKLLTGSTFLQRPRQGKGAAND
jgi:ParB/RepB/Spo0J family partition protein